MNIEIKITAESVEELQAALAELGRKPSPTINVTASAQAIAKGAELTIPGGTEIKAVAVTRDDIKIAEPEKPKRARKAAAKQPEPEAPAESAQEAAGEPEAPQAAAAPAEPEKPAEKPVEAAAAPAPTMDQIANAGARLLDADAGKMMPLLDLLREFGVQAITQLKDDQLAAFAERLRALGAEV